QVARESMARDEDLDEDGLYETELMISVCAGLVTLDEEIKQIRLVHYTTQNYLESIRKVQFPEAPSTISKICLTYLAFRPFAEKYCSRRSECKARLHRYPFLRYAARYWGDHVSDVMDDDVRELALKYLHNNISIFNANQIIHYDTGSFRDDFNDDFNRLHAIAAFNLIDIARDFLAESVDVNARAGWDGTPLDIAASAGQAQMVHALLQAGAEVTPKGRHHYRTPLHAASEDGHESVVRLFVEAGADCNKSYGYFDEKLPLQLAAEFGHVDVARVLIERGAKVNPCRGAKGYDYIHSEPPLNIAVKQGHEALVRLFLDNGANMYAIDTCGRTVLHDAAKLGHTKLIELLIERGIDVSVRDHLGQAALHYAAREGQVAIVKILLENNTDVLAEDQHGKTAVHEAVKYEHKSIIEMLLEHVGNENDRERWLVAMRLPPAVDQTDEEEARFLLEKGANPILLQFNDLSLLSIAVLRRSAGMLRLLLVNGAYADVKDDFGGTPLHWAAYSGYNAGIQLLLDHGANIEALDEDWAKPLHMAIRYGGVSVINQLLNNGAKLHAEDSHGRTALDWALCSMAPDPPPPFPHIRKFRGVKGGEDKEHEVEERLAVLDLLIKLGVDLNAPRLHGEVTLSLAIQVRCEMAAVAFARRILEEGIDVAAQDAYGASALHYAVICGLTEVARLLLEHGADVNQKTKNCQGTTALHAAAKCGFEEITLILVEAGADVEAVDGYGNTVLHEAVTSRGSDPTAVVSLLLSHGADINAHYGDRKATVLHRVVSQPDLFSMASFLIQRGARIAEVDEHGETTLDWAKNKGCGETVSILIELCR
ncbi:hypothetical protein EKO27_g8273, partial [Xylaria grammica]